MSALLSVPPRVALLVSTKGSRFGHSDGLRLLAGLDSQVHSDLLAHFEDDAGALDLLEAVGLDANHVGPGIRLGALYSPASSVVSVRVTPLSVSRTDTVAPATTPPLWSETVPRIRAEPPCEYAGKQSKSRAKTPPNNCKALPYRSTQVALCMELKTIHSWTSVHIKDIEDIESESGPTPQTAFIFPIPACSKTPKHTHFALPRALPLKILRLRQLRSLRTHFIQKSLK